jgi:hypothetical protein
MNLNDFAKEVCIKEGKKKSVNIGQVKEVIKLTLQMLAKYDDTEVIKVVNRYRK